jgi:catechol 2,3-dioxygenase-like lactoylglutathione lyase family enzyme
VAMAYRELPMKILGIGWLGLVSDRSETRQFYKEVLGLNLLEEKPAYAYYKINEKEFLEILPADSPLGRRQRNGAPAIGFLVEELDNAVKELMEAGVEFKSEIEEWRSDTEQHRWIYFEDPDGITLLLLERN